MNSNAAVVSDAPPPPPPSRKPIPRPWLHRIQTPLSLKEQHKPDVIWEDDDDDPSYVIDLLTTPKKLGLVESFQQLFQGFCVPKTSHASTQQHRITQSAPSVMAIWMESSGAPKAGTATATTAAPFNMPSSAAPTVIYIVHSPASSPMTPGHKNTARSSTTTWHQQYVSSTYNGVVSGGPPTFTPSPPQPPSSDASASKPPLARACSLPHSIRPPRVNRLSTTGKPPRPPPLRVRSATGDSTSSRHRRSQEIDWTAESLDQIMTVDSDDDDDDSTIQSIEDDEEEDCNRQWMMEWAAGAASPRQRKDSDNTFQSLVEPTYLRTCPIMLKDYNRCSILVSGWLVYSPGELAWTKGISRKDVYYMVVLQSERVLYLHAHGKSAGQSSQQEGCETSSLTRMELPKDAYVEMKLASKFLGKAIVVKSMSSNHQTLCTLLPVSLSPSFMKHGTMNLGPAAVAQHDAALHLMFALDSWIRSRRH